MSLYIEHKVRWDQPPVEFLCHSTASGLKDANKMLEDGLPDAKLELVEQVNHEHDKEIEAVLEEHI